VLPTLADLTRVKPPANIEGISFVPTLLNKGHQKKHRYLYWEFHENGGRQAIRMDKWKYVVYNVLNKEKRAAELFNLDTDPQESKNVASEHPAIVKKMEKLIKHARIPSPLFPFVENVK
jgi:arylsulfatase A-like enzyme